MFYMVRNPATLISTFMIKKYFARSQLIKRLQNFHSSNICKQNSIDIARVPERVPGLVAVSFSKNIGAMIEVTCENHSLTRRNEFVHFVENLAQNCRDLFEAFKSNQILFEEWSIDKKELSKLPWLQKQNTTVEDLISINSKQFGEEIILQQAVLCRVPDFAHISGYAHPGGEQLIYPYTDCQAGFHAALVAFVTLDNFIEDNKTSLNELGRRLCQHIVGSVPTVVGSTADQPLKNTDEEFRLLCQEYLLDPDFIVAEIVQRYKLEILGFRRLEIGKL